MAELNLSGLNKFNNSNRNKQNVSNSQKRNKGYSGGSGSNRNQHKGYNSNKNHSANGQTKGGYSNKNGRDNNPGSGYVGAPYNFVPFYNETIPVDKKQMEVHGVIDNQLLTGEIAYQLIAQTPIFVDDSTEHHDFTRNARNQYAIPGSTMRGLIRNNVQILGVSGFNEDIDDYYLMYRNVANGIEKERYKDVLGLKQVSVNSGSAQIGVLTHVKAGYIAKKNGHYVIYRTKVDKISADLEEMNYYVLSERTIADDYSSGKNAYPYFKKHPEVLQHDVSRGFEREVRGRRVQYKGIKNKEYRPGYYPVSYEVKNLKNVAALNEKGRLLADGTLVCTGSMNMKKALYVVPEIDRNKPEIKISEVDEKAFRIDFEYKKTTLKRFHNVDFFNLPKDGEEKPVFYIFLNQRLYFGFTPNLRLFYDHSVKEGYRQKTTEFDYAKSLFGMSTGQKSYKSKVSFSDAPVDGKTSKGKTFKVILGEPKTTSYLDYLKQDKGKKTYNADNFELRGIKQYWLHKEIVAFDSKGKNEKVVSTMNPLPEGTVFNGKVRFQNLTEAELGLLVWSIVLEKNSRMNVGKAKAYGFGAISVSDVKVKTVNVKKAYNVENMFSLDPFEDRDVQLLIDAYKKEAEQKLGQKVELLSQIKDFFRMKDVTVLPDPEKIRYMSLEKKEYQSRKDPLPSIQKTIKK